jgi:Zn-dependent protease with chaperone function
MTIAVIASAFGILASFGVLLVVLLLTPIISRGMNRKAMALIHGSGIRVSEKQFPEIHACVTGMAQRLGLTRPIEVYVVEEKVVNAATVRYGKKNVILLTDELIDSCLRTRPEALAFILGHEVGHIALKHTGVFRSWVRQHYKKLGQLDEYSADRVASRLVGEKMTAFYGLLILTVGHSMVPHVNTEEVMKQAAEVRADRYSKKAEKTLTHPLLLNRVSRLFEPN